MQQQQPGRARQIAAGGAAAVGLMALVALLITLALTGASGSAHAAPQSGGNPTLEITSIDGNDLTVIGTQWQPGDTITLGYATTTQTTALTPLPISMNPFSIEADSFTVNLTWPSSVAANTYYLGAEGQVTGGPFFYAQPLQVDTMGKVVSGVIATATFTPVASGSASVSATSGAANTPHATATHKVAGGGSTSTPTPGNLGTSTDNPALTLGGIIVLCVLVLALVIYLLRIWLRGRQAGP